MATLISGYITLDKLKEIVRVCESKNEKGFKFTASVNETSNQYGQNVSFYAEQTKEQREAKANKYFFGNGKVFWTDGVIKIADKQETTPAPLAGEVAKAKVVEDDSLPF